MDQVDKARPGLKGRERAQAVQALRDADAGRPPEDAAPPVSRRSAWLLLAALFAVPRLIGLAVWGGWTVPGWYGYTHLGVVALGILWLVTVHRDNRAWHSR